MGYIPHIPPPVRATEVYLSAAYFPDFALQIGIKCEYCSSLNNATKFDNCCSCGAPLGVQKTSPKQNPFK